MAAVKVAYAALYWVSAAGVLAFLLAPVAYGLGL